MSYQSTGSSTATINIDRKPTSRTTTYKNLPLWQKHNHFIRSGYLRETLSYKACIHSLTFLHNESINVYSHLIPAVLALGIISLYMPEGPTFYYYLFGVATTICLGLSAVFHCIKTHSCEVDKAGSQCDYFGIVIMITLSLISAVQLGLPSKEANTFTAMFFMFGVVCAILTLHSKFGSMKYRPLRAGMFLLFGLSGSLPVLWSVNEWGYEGAAQKFGLKWYLREATSYTVGAVLYASQVPERFGIITPDYGRFDLIGSSHNIFHCFVVLGCYCHWRGLLVLGLSS